MRRVHRGKAILALAAWLLPWVGTAATGLHLAFDDHHLSASPASTLPTSLHGPAHMHEAPGQAPALAAFDAPRFAARRGFAGRAGPGPDPPHLAAAHSILRI